MSSLDYFTNQPARVAALRTACESWRGTPFRERSMVKGAGGGVDCGGFVGSTFYECGAVPLAISVPPYHVNHAEHNEVSQIRQWFEQPDVRVRVRRVDEDEVHVDGDLVFPEVGRTEHHIAIRIGREIYHIARPSGWCCMQLSQLKLRSSRYRLMEEPA